MALDEGDLSRAADPLIDLDRAAQPGSPPVPGAQWDELHRRWERWDDEVQAWRVVGASGDIVRPPSQGPVPAFLAGEVAGRAGGEAASHAATEADPLEDDDGRIHIVDVDRLAAPSQPVPGAQWNEVRGRWERWDDVLEEWIEARPTRSPR